MSSIDKLCFILVERQKANLLRRKHLARFKSANKRYQLHMWSLNKPQKLKDPKLAKLAKQLQDSHESYRRIADLMNDQRPLLKQLREDSCSAIKYNTSNNCISVVCHKRTLQWSDVTRLANAYVFESIVLTDEKRIKNPYAKELYAKETKQDSDNSTN